MAARSASSAADSDGDDDDDDDEMREDEVVVEYGGCGRLAELEEEGEEYGKEAIILRR